MTITEPDSAERRRGRWLVLALVLVLALGVGGTALAQRYEPLVQGSWTYDGDATRVTADSGDDIDGVYGGEVLELPQRPGQTASVIVSVRNTGRFAITVDGVLPSVGTGFGLVRATGVPVEGKTPLQGSVDLPYRLGPGKEVGLRLVYRLPACGFAAGSRTRVEDFPVRWHAFRSDHVTFLPMTAVQYTSPTDTALQPCGTR